MAASFTDRTASQVSSTFGSASEPPPSSRRTSRPPLARPAPKSREITSLELALHLATILQDHALEAIAIVDAEGRPIAAAGRTEGARTLALLAAAFIDDEAPLGEARSFEGGRIHVEVVEIAGETSTIALRGDSVIEDTVGPLDALRALLAVEDPNERSGVRESMIAPRGGNDDDGDFELEFDLLDVG
jgi:hypothetical protein